MVKNEFFDTCSGFWILEKSYQNFVNRTPGLILTPCNFHNTRADFRIDIDILLKRDRNLKYIYMTMGSVAWVLEFESIWSLYHASNTNPRFIRLSGYRASCDLADH